MIPWGGMEPPLDRAAPRPHERSYFQHTQGKGILSASV